MLNLTNSIKSEYLDPSLHSIIWKRCFYIVHCYLLEIAEIVNVLIRRCKDATVKVNTFWSTNYWNVPPYTSIRQYIIAAATMAPIIPYYANELINCISVIYIYCTWTHHISHYMTQELLLLSQFVIISNIIEIKS